MANAVSQLAVYCIDFFAPETQEVSQPEKKKEVRNRILKDALIPAYIIADAAKEVIGASQAKMMEKVHPITTETELASFQNPFGNQWVIRTRPTEKVGQFYVQHPKKAKSNLLIEANQFNKFIYDEYCAELINFCCSHCPAKAIEITSTKTAGGKFGGGYKGIKAALGGGSTSSEIFSVRSDRVLVQQEPFAEYLWLEDSLMQSIRTMSKGTVLVKESICDFSFNMSADFLKYISANLNFAQSYTFSIRIES